MPTTMESILPPYGRSNTRPSHTGFDGTLVPPPLVPKTSERPKRQAVPMPWGVQALPTRTLHCPTLAQHPTLVHEHMEHGVDLCAGQRQDTAGHKQNEYDDMSFQLPRRPPKAWHASVHRMSRRISLAPSETSHPIAAIHDGYRQHKAEQMLGLRRHSRAPPVPPKDTPKTSASSLSSSISHAGILPMHYDQCFPKLELQNGRMAWLHALTAVLVVFNCWGLPNAFGLFQAYFERDYLSGTSTSTIAWIGSTQFALVFGLGVPVGRLVDKGYFCIIFHSGTVCMIFGIFLTSFCKKFWSLWLVQGLITGLGMGCVFCSGIVALMTWFDETKIGIAMGLGAAGSCIGGIAYTMLTRHLLRDHSFAVTMRVLSAVAAATIIPPNLVFRMRNQKHKVRSRRSLLLESDRLISASDSTHSFAEPAYLFAAAGLFFSFLGLYFGFVFMIPFGVNTLHLSDDAATNILIYMLLANLPGRFVPALISDKCIGPLNTIIPSTLLCSCVIWLWAATSKPTQGSLTVIACFYGFVSAGIQVLYAPAVYSFCLEPLTPTTNRVGEGLPQSSMDRMGMKAGGIFSCIGVACLIGTPIGGALIDYRTQRTLDQPYIGAQIFAGTCLLLGGCLLLASRVKKAGWHAKRA